MIAPGDVWYGTCSYWTDDLSKLKTTPRGIPCCPEGHVGFEMTAPEWWESAREFESNGNRGYVEWLKLNKESHGVKWGRLPDG